MVVNALPSQTATPAEALDEVYVRARNGDMVPITAVALDARPGPLAVTHENQYTTMDLSYNLAPNVSTSVRPRRSSMPPSPACAC